MLPAGCVSTVGLQGGCVLLCCAVDKGISVLACLCLYDKQDADKGLALGGFDAKAPHPLPDLPGY